MKEKKFILLLIGFVAMIGIAVVGYNYLSENYRKENISGKEDDNYEENHGDSKEKNKTGIEDEQEKDSANNTQTQEEVKALDFQVEDADGNTVKLSDYYDKPIVMNFWATWCGPCKSELPAFDDLYKEYGEEVHFLMINLTDGSRETVEGVKEFLDENGYEFPVYFDTESIAAYVYGAYSIPLSVFVDESQNVVGYQVGAMDKDTIRSYIEDLKDDTR